MLPYIDSTFWLKLAQTRLFAGKKGFKFASLTLVCCARYRLLFAANALPIESLVNDKGLLPMTSISEHVN